MVVQSISDGGVGHPLVFALLPPSDDAQPSLKLNRDGRWVLEATLGETVLAVVIVGVYEY